MFWDGSRDFNRWHAVHFSEILLFISNHQRIVFDQRVYRTANYIVHDGKRT